MQNMEFSSSKISIIVNSGPAYLRQLPFTPCCIAALSHRPSHIGFFVVEWNGNRSRICALNSFSNFHVPHSPVPEAQYQNRSTAREKNNTLTVCATAMWTKWIACSTPNRPNAIKSNVAIFRVHMIYGRLADGACRVVKSIARLSNTVLFIWKFRMRSRATSGGWIEWWCYSDRFGTGKQQLLSATGLKTESKNQTKRMNAIENIYCFVGNVWGGGGCSIFLLWWNVHCIEWVTHICANTPADTNSWF